MAISLVLLEPTRLPRFARNDKTFRSTLTARPLRTASASYPSSFFRSSMSPSVKKGLLAGLALVALVGAFGAWYVFGSITPDYGTDKKRGVKIPPGAAFSQIVDSLDASGIVKSRSRFERIAQWTGWARQLDAGYYEVKEGTSAYDLLGKLRRGEQSYVKVTVPPGVTLDRLAAISGRNLYAGPDGMKRALTSDSLARALGTEQKNLLGFMLPDTYFFFWLDSPNKVVKTIKGKFDDLVRENGPQPDGLTNAQVATMASIVEWETAKADERPRVAEVYLNRYRIGMPLQADPTVQYAILEREGAKRRLLFVDYRIQHPYNTYLFKGLPPGPVTNPGASAVKAVLKPEDHDYLYFVAKGDGGHVFSRTLAEHARAAEAFYATMRERRAAQRAAEGDSAR